MSGLGYRDTADPAKPAVLLLHGFLGCKEDWREVIAGLEGDFRCIAVDLPGHGQSTALDESAYSMDGCAAAVIALLDALDIASCHMVGYSMGGRLALYLLVNYGKRFTSAVIESGSAGLKTHDERQARRTQDAAVAERLQTLPVAQFVSEWYNQSLFASLHRDSERLAQVRMQRATNDPVGLATSLRCMGTGAQPSLWPYLNSLQIPVLYLAGGLDTKFSLLAAEMAAATPHGSAEVFGDCGHILHFEQPRVYIERVRMFLKGHSIS